MLSTLIGMVAFALVSTGADSCGTTTTNTPDDSSDRAASGDKSAGASADVGDSITIDTSDTKLKTTVLRVIDPVSAGEFDEPSHGKRYVGIQIAIRNVGDKTYDDSPSNGAQLIDNHDEKADPTLLTEGDCAGDFSSQVTLSPGSREQGCIAFEIKKHAKPKLFQFAGDSGFGPETAEWSLK